MRNNNHAYYTVILTTRTAIHSFLSLLQERDNFNHEEGYRLSMIRCYHIYICMCAYIYLIIAWSYKFLDSLHSSISFIIAKETYAFTIFGHITLLYITILS